MIPHQEALALVLEHVKPLPRVMLPLHEATGCALARPYKAPCALPRFDQSAMDGIAVRLDDVTASSPRKAVTLQLAGEMPAGTGTRLKLRKGQAIKVFTGGPLPSGTQAVVIIEHCEIEADRISIRSRVKAGDHIRRRGEELRRGDPLLSAGTRLTPPVIGLLAGCGATSVAVHRPPRVAVLTMGDELADAGTPLQPGQIYDANGPALVAALKTAGLHDIHHQSVGDCLDTLIDAMRSALTDTDILITVGGASVGDHDHVANARKALGIRDIFDRVAVKPGKPNIFGLYKGRVPVFGLPGNPVSALVSHVQLVRPALRALSGLPQAESVLETAILTLTCRKRAGRTEFLRGMLRAVEGRLHVEPHRARESHMLSGLAAADVLLELPLEAEIVKAGQSVRIHRLNWDI
jgi:molybdopterin molybdotransferase